MCVCECVYVCMCVSVCVCMYAIFNNLKVLKTGLN